jgi:DNA-binding transcriptional regulator YdaS (Cro superfamily)
MGLTRLGRYLEKNKETQGAFADRAQVPAPMVSVWSRNATAVARIPGLANALKIEAATSGEVPTTYWPRLAQRLRARHASAT